MEVVDGGKRVRGVFVCGEEVIEVGEGIIFAGMARAIFFDGGEVVFVDGFGYFYAPFVGKKCSVASSFGGVGGVEGVDAERDSLF